MNASAFFALPDSLAVFRPAFSADVRPWEWVKAIGPALEAADLPAPVDGPLKGHPLVTVSGRVHIDPTVRFIGAATLIGPAWIGPGVEVRPGAFVRGNVIVGAGSVLGNSCEYKNCLLLEGVQTMHFNYVGDSVLGNRAHLGAGVVCSNLRLDQKPVVIALPDGPAATGLRKLGAILGDDAEVGCNAVLNPGSLLGPGALVAPTLSFSGYLPPRTIARARTTVSFIPRRD